MDELGLASFPKTSGATGFHILAPIKPRAPLPGGAPLREGARPGGRAAGSTTRTWPRRPGRWPTEAASSSTTARTPATARSRRPTRSAPRRTRAPRLRLRWEDVAGRRSGRLHARDHAQARRRRGRPHEGHVAAEGQPRFALRAARPRSPGTVGSPFFGRGRTWATVHCSGSLSGRKRRKRELWRKRPFCHLS